MDMMNYKLSLLLGFLFGGSMVLLLEVIFLLLRLMLKSVVSDWEMDRLLKDLDEMVWEKGNE